VDRPGPACFGRRKTDTPGKVPDLNLEPLDTLKNIARADKSDDAAHERGYKGRKEQQSRKYDPHGSSLVRMSVPES